MRIIAGRFRGKQLKSPTDDAIRPTTDRVRESLFSILASRLGPNLDGTRVLDLFAGTGALGLEAVSRGASHVVFVDTEVQARGLIRDHIEMLGLGGQAKLLRRDATDLGPVESFGEFDLIFLDPPYGKGLGEQALQCALDGGWVAEGALIVLEEASDAVVNVPDGLKIDDQRVYGDTQIVLISRS